MYVFIILPRFKSNLPHSCEALHNCTPTFSEKKKMFGINKCGVNLVQYVQQQLTNCSTPKTQAWSEFREAIIFSKKHIVVGGHTREIVRIYIGTLCSFGNISSVTISPIIWPHRSVFRAFFSLYFGAEETRHAHFAAVFQWFTAVFIFIYGGGGNNQDQICSLKILQ